MAKIVYTLTDEAPMLATYALLPVIKRFVAPANLTVETSDISVAARILAQFPENLTDTQKHPDTLSELGELAKKPEANIIKLPNISASVPQLLDAIAELQSQGYNVPNYPAAPKDDAEKDVKARYAKVLGSAVNPVLREGNSDRRVAGPVKEYAQKNPHKLGDWSKDSKTEVKSMTDGDFYSSELSVVVAAPTSVKIEHVAVDGSTVTVLKEKIALQAGEVIDASVMRKDALREFFEKEMQDAKEKGLLFSLHLKATMMKVSDPILFGHAVTVFFKDVFEKHAATFSRIGVDANNGLGSVLEKISTLPEEERKAIEADIQASYDSRPDLAMVDSDRGITNLHVPSDVIIDASMPVVVRDSGKMWNKANKLQDTKAIIPDRSYSGIYAETVAFCKEHGQFNVSTMGNVSNVGLMAQKAEEYGSHDKTFQQVADGTVRVVDASGATLMEHSVKTGDIWRMCQTKDEPIKDWVKLAVGRARATGNPAIFWLDDNRAHDRQITEKVKAYLPLHNIEGLDVSIKSPVEAIRVSMDRAKAGLDTISVTGNVLRDYLTDLFPILELGTSAKMLSIVPLLAGGGMFETGAGGSAPKHVQQFVQEGHLRWDSLGEYLALAVSLEDLGEKTGNAEATVLSKTLNVATAKVLDNCLSPSRKVKELDNRGTTFYIAMHWAAAMAEHDENFKELAQKLAENEKAIVEELISCQGTAVDLGGYYHPDPIKTGKAMRPSALFNSLID